MKLNYMLKKPCPKCPYTLGFVHTVKNPCPECKANGYQSYEHFKKYMRGEHLDSQKKDDIMSEKVKLPRLGIYPKIYTTGDDQRWTYEYTWEDFDAAATWVTTEENEDSLHVKILRYFVEHPEKAIEGGICKERGYTAEDVVKRITYRRDDNVSTTFEFHRVPI